MNSALKDKNRISRRNSAMDMCRLFFAVLVPLVHFESIYFPKTRRIFEGGYLAAEFYFILAGYLLYRSFRSGRYKNALDYTFIRYIRFFCYAFVVRMGLLCLDLYSGRPDGGWTGFNEALGFALEKLRVSLGELFLVQMVVPSQLVNSPIWYLSAMLIAGFALCLLLDIGKLLKAERSAVYLIFILSLLCYSFFFVHYRTLDVHMDQLAVGSVVLRGGLLRAFADMGFGVFCSMAAEKLRLNAPGWSLMASACLVLMGLCIFLFPHKRTDLIFVSAMGLFAVISFADEWGRAHLPAVPGFLTQAAFSCYICHMLIMRCWIYALPFLSSLTGGQEFPSMALFVLICFLCGALLELIMMPVNRLISRLNKRSQNA
ncbi:MAG: acyltransferase family protein [Firmicutes bacterium]|nr:acyltransferase family protein [Bacillota bacterium]